MVDFDRFTAITVPNVHLKIRQLYIPVFFNSCMRGLLLSSFFSQLFINFLRYCMYKRVKEQNRHHIMSSETHNPRFSQE